MNTAHIIINGKQLGFVAREAKFAACDGCIFAHNNCETCYRAGVAATKVGQPDCDDVAPNHGSYIYVEADHRQGELLGASEHT